MRRLLCSVSFRALVGLVPAVAGCDGPQAAALEARADAPAATDEVVARWSGGQLSSADVEARLGAELRQFDIQYRIERYERLRNALDAAVLDALVDAEVSRRGLPGRDALYAAEVDAKLVEPTEEELRAEFERFVKQMPGADFDSARPHLRAEVLDWRRESRRESFHDELRAAADVHVDFPYPELPRVDVPTAADDPVLGEASADVTIVQFGGYECYYCRRVEGVLRRVVDAYPGRVRLVYKDFPIAGHELGRQAAVAAHCAGQQGRYWEMSRVLLDNQGQLERSDLESYVRDLGLDMMPWRQCMDDPTWQANIDADLKVGHDAGVTSTPTFFVNGLMLTGAHRFERFSALVDSELARVDREAVAGARP